MARKAAKEVAGDAEPEKGEASLVPTEVEQPQPWQANPLLLVARFPSELADNPRSLAQFQAVCIAVNLNPFLGEIVPIHGRPYITEEGWLRMIDERAPGQLVADSTEIASKEEKAAFGIVAKGWLGKATITRLVWIPGMEPRERTVVDYYFFSETAYNNTVIDAVREEPYRQAMKGAHVRALRKAFRDVLARTAGDYAMGDAEYNDPEIIEGLSMATLTAGDDDPMASERRRFWARATELGIRNGSQELSDVLGINAVGVGVMKEHYLDQGHSWADANELLDALDQAKNAPAVTGKIIIPKEPSEDIRTVQCHFCGGLTNEPLYTSDGAVLVCSEKCGKNYEAAHPREEGAYRGGQSTRRPARRR